VLGGLVVLERQIHGRPAGIVTGVGFLGAGVIVKSKEIVRGLTTAACICSSWHSASSSDRGCTPISFASTAIAIANLTLLARLAHRIPSGGHRNVRVSGRAEDVEAIETACRQALAAVRLRIVGLSARLSKETGSAKLTLRLRARNAVWGLEPSKRLLAIPEVREVTWE
jgi:putative Mg2+ transporter-C (MgtC) family protein